MLHFSKMWTLLVCGVFSTAYHSTQQNVNSWYFYEKSKNHANTTELVWFCNRESGLHQVPWSKNYRQPLLVRPHHQNLLQSKEAR